jgi:FeS assembly SUF system regulator
MLRLSKLTDYGVVVLVALARDGEVQTSPAIACATGIPEPTVAKVLKFLAAGGLVSSRRGARGGYVLDRKLDQIAISEVITAIDGPIALTACVEGSGLDCGTEARCPVRGRWDRVNHAIRQALADISLADMQNPPMFGARGGNALSTDMRVGNAPASDIRGDLAPSATNRGDLAPTAGFTLQSAAE